jgi:hypothetical protein
MSADSAAEPTAGAINAPAKLASDPVTVDPQLSELRAAQIGNTSLQRHTGRRRGQAIRDGRRKQQPQPRSSRARWLIKQPP